MPPSAAVPDAGVVLVTGASGFVGSHLVEQLVAIGRRVRCVVRPRSNLRWLPRDAIEIAIASLEHGQGLPAALRDVTEIHHLAAVTSAAHVADYGRVNVGGTQCLIEAVEAHAPSAVLVLCSSLAAGGPAMRGAPRRESDAERPIGPYGESKLAAERVVARSRLRYTIVRPPTVYGPRDHDVFVMLQWIARRIAPRLGPRGQELSFLHGADLARGMILAAMHADGEIYYLTDGAVYRWADVVRLIAAQLGVRPREVGLPIGVARAAARLARATARLTGARPLLTPERLDDLRQEAWTCDDRKARHRLGYTARYSLEEGMAETIGWYREHRWL